jgi:3-methyladenine DNA glycosylase Tag
MVAFKPILEAAKKRAGGMPALERRLPVPKSARALKAVADDRYLSLMSLRVFRAGLKHAVVDARWPAFEDAFKGFEPKRVLAISDEGLEALMKDRRLIRHWSKMKSVRDNAAAMVALAEEKGSFGAYLAEWPVADAVGLWDDLAKRFRQLGGNSGAYFLRMAGKDTFILTESVANALRHWGAFQGAPKGKADKRKVQAAFNEWSEATGRPLCQLSMILALSVD